MMAFARKRSFQSEKKATSTVLCDRLFSFEESRFVYETFVKFEVSDPDDTTILQHTRLDAIITDSNDLLSQGIEDTELFLRASKNENVAGDDHAAERQGSEKKKVYGLGEKIPQEFVEHFKSLLPLASAQLLNYCGKMFCACLSQTGTSIQNEIRFSPE